MGVYLTRAKREETLKAGSEKGLQAIFKTPRRVSPSGQAPTKSKILLNVEKRLGQGGNAEYDFKLIEGSKVVGYVQSDSPVNVYFFDSRNHSKWSNDEDFTYEGDQDITRCDFDVDVSRTGRWHLVLENAEEEIADVTVKLQLSEPTPN